VHILIIPRKHIGSVNQMEASDEAIWAISLQWRTIWQQKMKLINPDTGWQSIPDRMRANPSFICTCT
jgi:hypothetical protein